MKFSDLIVPTIALAGFSYGICGHLYLRKQAKVICNEEYYIKALEILKANPGAKLVMGDSMEYSRFDLSDEKNFCNGKEAHFNVPIKGSKAIGMYHFWASKNNTEWTIDKAELSLSNDSSKRLVIKKINS